MKRTALLEVHDAPRKINMCVFITVLLIRVDTFDVHIIVKKIYRFKTKNGVNTENTKKHQILPNYYFTLISA